MPKYCPSCGTPIESEVKFCPSCGAKQPEGTVPAVRPETAPVTPPENASPSYSLYEGQQTMGPHPQYGPSDSSAAGAFGAAAFGAASGGMHYTEDVTLEEKFLRHDNRLNRKRYIMRQLALIAASFAISFVAAFIAIIAFDLESTDTLATLISFCLSIPAIMLNIRRLHDLDRTGWWCLALLIPLANLALAVYLLFFEGTKGPNKYGPDPLEGMH